MKIAPHLLLANPFALLGLLLGLGCVGGPILLCLQSQPTVGTVTDSSSQTSHRFQRLALEGGQANDCFGQSVAIYETTAVVGCPQQRFGGAMVGSAHIFRQDPVGHWRPAFTIEKTDLANGTLLGSSVAVGAHRALIGICPHDVHHPGAPAVYVYEEDEHSNWRQTDTIAMHHERDAILHTASIALDRDTAIIGHVAKEIGTDRTRGLAGLFRIDDQGAWRQVARLPLSDEPATGDGHFGSAVALNGTRALVGAPLQSTNQHLAGAAFIYQEDPQGVWRRAARLVAEDAQVADGFGISVSIGERVALVGANGVDRTKYNSGAVYLFHEDENGQWTQSAKLTPADAANWDGFGSSVSLENDVALVGAPGCNDGAGAVYVFRISDSGAEQIAKLVSPDPAPRSRFGRAVALSGNTILAGAPWTDFNEEPNSGSAYATSLFQPVSPVPFSVRQAHRIVSLK